MFKVEKRRPALRRLIGSALALAVLTAAAVAGANTALTDQSLGSTALPRRAAGSIPRGFSDSVVLTGLTRPTTIAFARDGRVFVAEQSGIIRVFDNLRDPQPKLFADLSADVNSYWENGLLGLALAPNFPSDPHVYVLYTRDAPIGGTSPVWNDVCPTPPGPFIDGCVVSGRLARLQASGDQMVGAEQILLDGWCEQYPTHSIGSVAFGPDGSLYVSGGEGSGSGFVPVDFGQLGGTLPGSPTARNPCGDPPVKVGGRQKVPQAEGGSLRAQSLRRPQGQPVLLSGAVLRINSASGGELATNPLSTATDPNARRIVAYGLRNPFRFTIRPGTSELWIGDVGEFVWEEIDRIAAPRNGPVPNFGWPCYEGPFSNPKFAKLKQCKTLTPRQTVYPYFAYDHYQPVVKGDHCSIKPGAAVTGLAFYARGSYPAAYRRGLFFGDYTRGCIWFMPAGRNGLPDPHRVRIFTNTAGAPVDLQAGPGGDIFYVDLKDGTVHRIVYAH